MRILVLLLSMAMPLVAWFSQQGAFGATNGAISDRYPTLVVAAGYAFSIWGLIFLLDVLFGLWQLSSRRTGSVVAASAFPPRWASRLPRCGCRCSPSNCSGWPC